MKRLLIGVGVFVFVVLGRTLSGQESPADTITFQEITITGSKIERPLKAVKEYLQVISKEDIQNSAAIDLSQLLQNLSSILVNGAYSNPGKDKGVYMQGASSKYTLILLDGVPVSDPSGVGGPVDLRLISLNGIERVEILSGNQTTLYGTDAIAGVINLVSSVGVENQQITGNLGLSAGSFSTYKASGNISGALSKIKFQISANYQESAGINEVLEKTGMTEYDRDGFDQNSIRARFEAPIGKNFSFQPVFQTYHFAGDFDADAFLDAPNHYSGRLTHWGGTIKYKNKVYQSNLNFTSNHSNRKFLTDFGEEQYQGIQRQLDWFSALNLGSAHQLIGGIQYQNFDLKSSGLVSEPQNESIISPYLQFQLNTTKKLSADLGFRYSHHSRYGAAITYQFSPAYRINDHLKIYSSLSSGYKVPTLSELYGQFGANPDLREENSQSWQTGIQFENAHWKIEGSYFFRNTEDIIVYDFSLGYQNSDRQKDHGFNFTGRFRVHPNWTVRLSYNFLDGQITAYDQSGSDSTYHNLIRRPKHSIKSHLTWEAIEKLSLQLGGQWIGQRTDLFFNPDNFYLAEEVTLNAYFLANLNMSWQFHRGWNCFLNIRNLFNQGFTEVYGYNTMGINADIGLRWLIL